MAELHKYDYGTVLKINVVKSDGTTQDISGATSILFFLEKPNEAIITRTGTLTTNGSDGLIQYTVASGDLDMIGIWSIQGRVVTSGGSYSTSISEFRVDKNLDS